MGVQCSKSATVPSSSGDEPVVQDEPLVKEEPEVKQIKQGDRLPQGIKLYKGFPPEMVDLAEYIGERFVIVVGFPGAFTPI